MKPLIPFRAGFFHAGWEHARCAVLAAALFTLLSACDLLASDTDSDGPVTAPAELEITIPRHNELIFSSVKGTSSEPQQVTVRNTGSAPLALSALVLTGPDAAAFELLGSGTSATLEPGSSQTVEIAFAPSTAGMQWAQLEAGNGSLALYGLGSEGEQGSNEPPLQQVVDTLGYAVDVGGVDLELGKISSEIGDEVLVPLFEKAGSGPVTLEVVARYGPEETLPYGFFDLDASEAVLHEVGTIAAEDAQELLPPVASGGTAFEPGSGTFGVYGQASGKTQYSLDSLNEADLAHALRVYPAKDRDGEPIANSYLVGLEEAENGDYQDVLFVLGNVVPATTNP